MRRRTRLQMRRRPWSSLLRQAPGAGGGSGIRRGASTAGAAPSTQRTRRMAAGRRLLRWRWRWSRRVQQRLSLAASAQSVRGLVASSSIRQPRPASNGPSGFDAQSEALRRRQGMPDSAGAMRSKLSAVPLRKLSWPSQLLSSVGPPNSVTLSLCAAAGRSNSHVDCCFLVLVSYSWNRDPPTFELWVGRHRELLSEPCI